MKKQEVFLNSDYVVVEYMDLLKSPYLTLLNTLRQHDSLNEVLKLDTLKYASNAGLYEWYINRKHQNFLVDLNRHPDIIPESSLDQILEEQMDFTDELYTKSDPLLLVETIKTLKRTEGLVKDVIIYHPHNNDFAEKDFKETTGMNFTFMSDINEIIDVAGANSTYFFSNIENVLALEAKNCLQLSSVTIPYEYRYNKKSLMEWKLDLDELNKKYIFKLTFCFACSYVDEANLNPDEIEEEDENS